MFLHITIIDGKYYHMSIYRPQHVFWVHHIDPLHDPPKHSFLCPARRNALLQNRPGLRKMTGGRWDVVDMTNNIY